ncbi:NUDIX domain-containing protein [Nanoarchaeota archaeon]
MRLPVQLQGIIFYRTKDEIKFLLLKRTKKRGGFWQAVTGGYEDTDGKIKAACLREIEEETGIKKKQIINIIEDVHFFQFKVTDLFEKPTVLSEYVLGIEIKKEIKPKLDNYIYREHDKFKWCTFEQALKLFKHKSSKDALKKLKRKIKL